MEIVEVTWGRAFRVWWSFFWRTILFGMIGALGVGFVLGIIEGILGVPPHIRVLINLPFGLAFGVFVGVWIFKTLLYKRFADFSVVCIANDSGARQQERSVTVEE